MVIDLTIIVNVMPTIDHRNVFHQLLAAAKIMNDLPRPKVNRIKQICYSNIQNGDVSGL